MELECAYVNEVIDENALNCLCNNTWADSTIYDCIGESTDCAEASTDSAQQYTLPVGEKVFIANKPLDDTAEEIYLGIVCTQKVYKMLQEIESNWRKSN